MKKIIYSVLFILASQIAFSQTVADSITRTWTKYIITNDKQEVLLIYSKYYGAWEHPGCGYEGPISLKDLMDSAAEYLGVRYDKYSLGGVFSYFVPGRYRATIKMYFVAQFTGYLNGKNFADTANLKWVSIEEAKKIIPYPTMVMILEQLTAYPDIVWGGTFEEYNYEPPSATKWKVVEQFYKLDGLQR